MNTIAKLAIAAVTAGGLAVAAAAPAEAAHFAIGIGVPGGYYGPGYYGGYGYGPTCYDSWGNPYYCGGGYYGGYAAPYVGFGWGGGWHGGYHGYHGGYGHGGYGHGGGWHHH